MSRRKVTVALVATVATLLLAATAYVVIEHGRSTAATAPPPPAVQTIAVHKTDLSNTTTITGTLGYGTPQPLKGTGQGVVTKLPKIGDVGQRGQALYAVNGAQVPVYFGDTPLFRKLDVPDLHGPDVAMVADNLVALGYSVGTRAKDRQQQAFTPALAAALKRWQKSAGLADTGTLDVGQVVVLPGPARVNTVTAQLGDPVAEPLLTVTSTSKVVTAQVDASGAGAIKTGAVVTLIRPDTKEVPAKVTAVSTIVDGQQQGPPKVTVTVTPDDTQAVADLDSASVSVLVTTEIHPGVLAVPVGALLALREGGYAVQVPDGTLKKVQTGMFARGMVEISGPGIDEGMQVVTTS